MHERISRQISGSINKKINEIANAASDLKEPTDLPSLRQKVIQLELHQEVAILREMLNDPASFKQKFKERCALRQFNTDSSISFSIMPESPANHLYFDIAALLFKPASLVEMLGIIMPNIKQQLHVSIPEELPQIHGKEERNNYIKNHLQPALTLSSIDHLTDVPDMEKLSHYVFCDDTLLNLNDMAAFPLPLQARLYSTLQNKFYKNISKKIYSHNASWQALLHDIQTYQNKGLTPKTVIENLIKGFLLQGTRMSGREETTDAIMLVLQPFFSYFEELPANIRSHLFGLKSEFVTLNDVIENQIKQGHCVETTSEDLADILEKNSQDKMLTTPPMLSAEGLHQLELKYHAKNNSSILEVKKDISHLSVLPDELTKQALKLIHPEFVGDAIVLLLSFTTDYYAVLFDQFDPEELPDFFDDLLEAISDGFFNIQQTRALAKVMMVQYSRWGDASIPMLHWATYKENPFFIRQLLSILSDAEKSAALYAKDTHGNTVVHRASCYPESLNILLSACPESVRLAIVKEKNSQGRTALHCAANNFNSIKIILKIYPEAMRLEALKVKDKYDNSILDFLYYSPYAFVKMLAFLPEEDRLAFLRIQAGHGASRDKVLHIIMNVVDIDAVIETALRGSGSFAPDFIRVYALLAARAETRALYFFEPANLASQLLDQVNALSTFDEIKKQVFSYLSKNIEHAMTAELFDSLSITGHSNEEKLESLQQRWNITREPPLKKMKLRSSSN